MENILQTDSHILLCIDATLPEEIKQKFCGRVFFDKKSFYAATHDIGGDIYFCGDVSQLPLKNRKIYIVREFSVHYDESSNYYTLINAGKIPLNIHDAGVFFKNFFDDGTDYFNEILRAHEFQSLSESTKPGTAYRTGVYMSHVEENGEETMFHLLRCSSNFSGPTHNFRDIDIKTISQVNDVCARFFEQKVELNHVLAQVYNNVIIESNQSRPKERKAKIKQHSDKTKDMPRNALIAFCSFYSDAHQKNGYTYKGISVLTKLRFRLKPCAAAANPDLEKLFDIILYPNSLFIISLRTNRLYTHEIIPSGLPIDKLPTRMGYVIRCSDTRAVHKNGKTYILSESGAAELRRMELPIFSELKSLYEMENATSKVIEYGDVIFSMNRGDYQKPLL